MISPKGEIQLLDKRLVPEYKKQVKLPIFTHRPHKWAMIDMQTGQIFVVNPDDVNEAIGANKEDIALIASIPNIKNIAKKIR